MICTPHNSVFPLPLQSIRIFTAVKLKLDYDAPFFCSRKKEFSFERNSNFLRTKSYFLSDKILGLPEMA